MSAENGYEELIGMSIRHKTFGAGGISSVFVEERTLYFTAKFIYYPDLKKFRVDLLGGWGGYFTDIAQKISAKGMVFPPKPIVEARDTGYGSYEGYNDDSDESYRDLLDEADSDNWANYYNEETGWYEP